MNLTAMAANPSAATSPDDSHRLSAGVGPAFAELGRLYRRGRYADALKLGQRLLELLPEGAFHERGRICGRLALFAAEDGALDQAMAMLEQAQEALQSCESVQLEGHLLCTRSYVFGKLSLYREAGELAKASLLLANRVDDAELRARALRMVGNRAGDLEDFEAAHSVLHAAISHSDATAQVHEAFWSLIDLIHFRGVEAVQCRESGNTEGALIHIEAMRPLIAQAYLRAEKNASIRQLAYTVSNEADIYIVMDDQVRAFDLLDRYLALARAEGLWRLVAYAHLDLARLASARKDYRVVVSTLTDPDYEKILEGHVDLKLKSDQALYAAHRELGDLAQALRSLERRSNLERQIWQARAELNTRVLLSQIDLAQERARAELAAKEAEVQRLRANALEQTQVALERDAREDFLTGLFNRRAADDLVSKRTGALLDNAPGPTCVAMLDVDFFKSINDRFGHAMGDKVLATLGRLVLQSIREKDLAFRYGGEEFLLVLNQTDAVEGQQVLERIRQKVESHPWEAVCPGLCVSVSIGGALHAAAAELAATVQAADEGLYLAKARGRNQVVMSAN